MKKWLIILTLVALVVSCSLSTSAAWHKNDRHDGYDDRRDDSHNDGPRRHREQYDQLQEDARHIINRTTTVIFEAQRSAMRGHRNFELSHAFAAQSRARDLYIHRQYREAIFHSLRARDIALRIIRNNGVRVKREFFPDSIEDHYFRERPRDEELDREHDQHRYGSDDDAVRIKIEFNIN